MVVSATDRVNIQPFCGDCDFRSICRLERSLFGEAGISQKLLKQILDKPGCQVMVAIGNHGELVGHLIYYVNSEDQRISIGRLVATDPYKENGLVDAFLYWLTLSYQSYRIQVLANERDVHKQLELRQQGFRVENTLKGFFGEDDGYLFTYQGCGNDSVSSGRDA